MTAENGKFERHAMAGMNTRLWQVWKADNERFEQQTMAGLNTDSHWTSVLPAPAYTVEFVSCSNPTRRYIASNSSEWVANSEVQEQSNLISCKVSKVILRGLVSVAPEITLCRGQLAVRFLVVICNLNQDTTEFGSDLQWTQVP